jgi:hypothetical protein
VKSLPSKHFRDYKEGTLWKMHEMLGSKAGRHAEAVAAYNAERIEVRTARQRINSTSAPGYLCCMWVLTGAALGGGVCRWRST